MNSRQNEQELAQIRDTIPRIWMSLYQGCIQAGFDEAQSFNLLQTWILAQNTNGSRPNEIKGPEGDST